MVPNLDLILLAFLHGCFIACVLLVVMFAILNGLLLAFSITLLSIVIFDVYDVLSSVSAHLESLKADFHLGFVLVLYMLTHYAVLLASKPFFEHMVSEFKGKALFVINHIDDLLLDKTRRL